MNYIVDDIGKVVELMREGGDEPYYLYGTRREIAARLVAMEKDKVLKEQKYPLVALRMDIPEVNVNGMIQYKLNLAILEFTDRKYNAEQRYANVFKPILYPLYEKFLKHLRESGLFTWPLDLTVPEHTKIDRPFWGTSESEGNKAQIFADPLDAIEIVDLKILQRIK